MNSDQFRNLLQISVASGAVHESLAGYTAHSTWQAILGGIVAIVTWYLSHKQNAATSVAPPGTTQGPRGPILLLFMAAALAIFGAGCSSAINSGHVVSVTERGFGIVIAQSTAQETPEVKLGFFSSAVVLAPTVTNQTLTAPNFANTFALGQSINPFAFDVNETIASGNYQTGQSAGGATNPIAAQPIVPSTNGNWPPLPGSVTAPAASQPSTGASPSVSLSSVTNALSSVVK